MPEESVEKKKLVLKERAQKLTESQKQIQQVQQEKNVVEVLKFSLAPGLYAIESEFVKEVYRVKDVTPLPTTPPHIVGLINVRRKIMPVVDLQVVFGLPKQDVITGKKAIILVKDDIEFAILIDDIIGVGPLSLDAVEFSRTTLTDERELYLQGVTMDGTALLDGKKLIDNPAIVVNDSNI